MTTSMPRRIGLAALTILAIGLLSPVLVKVYGHLGQTLTLAPGWLLAIGLMIVAHFVSVWALYRVVLRTSNWSDVASSHLAANATSHVSPAGGAIGAGIQLRMLTIAGFPARRAVTAMGAAAVLGTVAGYVVLPVGVLVASALTGDVAPRLVGAMWSAAGLLTVVLLVAVALATRDRPWRLAARIAVAVRSRSRRVPGAQELGDQLIHERDLIRAAIRDRALLVAVLALAQPLTDYAALYFALRAVGASVGAAPAMAAFVVSNVAGLVPLTPGGLGFVEAGLSRVLTVAGATHPQAHLAIVTYRLAATWLPCLAGFIALLVFHRRHRHQQAVDPSLPAASTPAPAAASLVPVPERS